MQCKRGGSFVRRGCRENGVTRLRVHSRVIDVQRSVYFFSHVFRSHLGNYRGDFPDFAPAPRGGLLKLQNIKVWQYGQVDGPAQPRGGNMMKIEKSKNPLLDLRLGSGRWHSIRQ